MRIRDVVLVFAVIVGLWITFVPPEEAKEQGSPAFGPKESTQTSVLDQQIPEMAAPDAAE